MTHPTLPFQRSMSGNPDVDEALARLYALDDLPVAAHPAVYESVHESLRSALDGPAVPATARSADTP